MRGMLEVETNLTFPKCNFFPNYYSFMYETE